MALSGERRDPFLEISPPLEQLLSSLPLVNSPILCSPLPSSRILPSSLPLPLELTFLPVLMGGNGKMLTVDTRLSSCLGSADGPVFSKLVIRSNSSSSFLSIITELAWMVVMNSLREAWMFWTDVSRYQGIRLRSRLTQYVPGRFSFTSSSTRSCCFDVTAWRNSSIWFCIL